MSQATQHKIEFIGGALDGHVEVVVINAERLPESITCYISENVFRLLDGQERQRESRITSMAIYQRRHRMGTWSYLFVGAIAPDEVTFEPIGKQSNDETNDL